VECALAAGAYGAKLSGAGLGGVVIALAPDIHTAQKIVKESETPSWWTVEGVWSMEIRKSPITGEYTLVSPHRLSRP